MGERIVLNSVRCKHPSRQKIWMNTFKCDDCDVYLVFDGAKWVEHQTDPWTPSD